MTSRNRLSSSLFAALFFVPGFFSPLLAQPQLLMMGDSGPGQPFRIGDSLMVALSGGEPFGEYTFQLLGPDGEQITQLGSRADAVGEVAPAWLWAYSGIETCQPPDPLGAQLATWEEAEATWNDRELLVQVSLGGGVVALGTLQATADTNERAYLSDEEGRPCNCFEKGKDVYLSLRQPERWAPERWIFVLAAPAVALQVEDVFHDVRSEQQDVWTLPDTGNLLTTRIWDGDDTQTGEYGVILRRESSSEHSVLVGDVFLSAPLSAARSGRGIALTIDCKGGNGVR